MGSQTDTEMQLTGTPDSTTSGPAISHTPDHHRHGQAPLPGLA
jgi:hypothetical protein